MFLSYNTKRTSNDNNKKVDFITIKDVCTSKDTIKKVKDNPQDERKYLQILYLMRYVSGIDKEFLQLNDKR